MKRKKQINPKWYMIWVAFIAIAITIVSLFSSWAPPKNIDPDANNLRIISLAPSTTEMIFALGMGDSVVGVTDHCDYPVEARDIERVGGMGPANIEKLLSLSPDLVITTSIPSDDICKLLSRSGIELLVTKIHNIQSMFEGLRHVGHAVGKPERAEKVIAEMQAELDLAQQLYSNIPREQRTRVFIEIWYDPITTVGSTSFIDDVIIRAGGANVAHNISQTYPRINPEKVIQWDPDVIITCYMGREGHTPEQMAKRIGWADISAVKSRRIINDFPSDLILRPGPRLIEGVKTLAGILHKITAEKITERQ
jgi:iron complex transport system substrate-binding protein